MYVLYVLVACTKCMYYFYIYTSFMCMYGLYVVVVCNSCMYKLPVLRVFASCMY